MRSGQLRGVGTPVGTVQVGAPKEDLCKCPNLSQRPNGFQKPPHVCARVYQLLTPQKVGTGWDNTTEQGRPTVSQRCPNGGRLGL